MVHGNWTKNTIFKLGLIGRCQGQAIISNHYFEATGAKEALLIDDTVAQAAGDTLAADWRTNLRAAWLACHTNDYFLDRIDAQVVERPGNFEHRLLATSDTTGAPAVGTIAAPADDLATSAVIRWRSTLAGKHHRGRTYVGPLYDVGVAAGMVSDAPLIASLNAYGAAMIARYTGAGAGVIAGYNLTVYSRPYSAPDGAYTKRVGGVLTVVNNTTDYDGDSTFISTYALDLVAREQRRREVGVGI